MKIKGKVQFVPAQSVVRAASADGTVTFTDVTEDSYQVVATFSDGRPAMVGPLEDQEAADARMRALAMGCARAILESVMAGDEKASFSITAEPVAAAESAA